MSGISDREKAFENKFAHDQELKFKALARRYRSDPEKFDGQRRVIIRMRVEKVIRHD